ncbi:hypothetical protein B0H17DRAFT_1227827 [Mycena rosella]|uniref:Uncharacterized protein n=1 Tax=Mycena rosella TaxID=1033263 RepID=A0AAD7GF31_MYCRO|nr:hypothetical protein B0H17DRAFT_1227827 [Mycena rosella]
MPKATKSPVKSPAKPRTPRTPNKKATSKLFIDNKAEESEEGELLYPESEPDEFPAALTQPPTRLTDASHQVDHEYDTDFINDGDPFADTNRSSPELTPPPKAPPTLSSPRKHFVGANTNLPSVKKPSPVKSKAVEEPVIDITSSEEDLEAMDEDNRKPSGVKAAMLPQPLRTRSASKHSLSDNLLPPTQKTRNKKAKTVTDMSMPSVPAAADMTQFALFFCVTTFMGDFMSAFLAQHLPSILAAQGVKVPDNVDPVKGYDKPVQSGSALRPKPTRVLRPSSPDWPPPYGQGGLSGSPTTPSPPGKATSSSKSKGKGKAVVSPLSPGLDDDDVSAEVSKFMQSPGKTPGKRPQTMAEYFGGTVDTDPFSTKDTNKNVEVSTFFLEDIEVYKAYFGDRLIIPVYDPNRIAGVIPPTIKGGRVKYSIWEKYIADMLIDNSMGTVLFKKSLPNFINPSRVSPVRLSSKPSIGSTTMQRLHVDDRIATCVSSLFCSESKLVSPTKIGGKSEHMRKWISGIFHNQEWERFESLMCLVFGQKLLCAQISTKHALSFQTMISPDSLSSTKDTNNCFDNSAPADMFSPVVSTKATKTPVVPSNFSSSRAKTLLAYNDKVPIYDARKVVVDFDADLMRLDDVLPPFIGEVPFSSFVVVGYTCSVYNAAVSGSSERAPHLGCNILRMMWAQLCFATYPDLLALAAPMLSTPATPYNCWLVMLASTTSPPDCNYTAFASAVLYSERAASSGLVSIPLAGGPGFSLRDLAFEFWLDLHPPNYVVDPGSYDFVLSTGSLEGAVFYAFFAGPQQPGLPENSCIVDRFMEPFAGRVLVVALDASQNIIPMLPEYRDPIDKALIGLLRSNALVWVQGLKKMELGTSTIARLVYETIWKVSGLADSVITRTTYGCRTFEQLSILILLLVFGDFVSSPKEYAELRRVFRQLDGYIRKVLDSWPMAWSHIYVEFSSDLLHLCHCIPDVVFTLLDKEWNRCSLLTIASSSDASAIALYSHIQSLWSASMSDLLIGFSGSFVPYDDFPLLFDNSGLTCRKHLPALSNIDFDGLMPFWSSPAQYASLGKLALCGLRDSATVNWWQLVDVFSHAICLEELHLISITCPDIPMRYQLDFRPTLPPFPRLLRLFIEVEDYSTACLASALQTPSLTSLSLTAHAEAHLRDVLYSDMPALQTIHTLNLDLQLSDATFLLPLLLKCPHVRLMDLSSSPSVFPLLCQLAHADMPDHYYGAILCPALSMLTLGCRTNKDLMHNLLVRRKSFAFSPELTLLVPHRTCKLSDPVEWFSSDGIVRTCTVPNKS